MAAITITRALNEQGGDYDAPLVSAFQQNSIEFTFERGTNIGTYATVEINSIPFFATLITADYATNTDLYQIDVSQILPAFLGAAPLSYTVTGLSATIGIDIKGYNAAGSVLATNTTHDDIELCFGYMPIGSGGGLDNLYEVGIIHGDKVYHNGDICFYYYGVAGDMWLTLDGGSTQQVTTLVHGFNKISGTYFNKSGTLTVNGEVSGLSIPCIYRAAKSGYVQIQWINRWGAWSTWYFRQIQKTYVVQKSSEIPIYAIRNSDMRGKSYDLNTDKSLRYDLDTVAVDDLHYSYLCEIAESPRVIFNSQVCRVAAIDDTTSVCRQNLKFNISLMLQENAVTY